MVNESSHRATISEVDTGFKARIGVTNRLSGTTPPTQMVLLCQRTFSAVSEAWGETGKGYACTRLVFKPV
jgi:hypothetical protein